MAHVILVHGIAHENDAAEIIEKDWGPALAGGVRLAGFPAVADRLWRNGPVAGGLDVRSAFYGHKFREAGAQGVGGAELSALEAAETEVVALECLRAGEHSADPEQRRLAREELAALGLVEAGQPQGVRSAGRSLVARLARLPWFARLGMVIAQRTVAKALSQVTRYFDDAAVRAAAQEAVLGLVGEETRAIVAHSLGTVVAYEACFHLEKKLPRGRHLPLLVTLGSPLGLANIVYHKLIPRPAVFPPQVRRWVNIADLNDVVAAEPDLRPYFGSVPEAALFESASRVHSGRDAHRAESYLTAALVGRPVSEALAD
jgi:hypothetical protein